MSGCSGPCEQGKKPCPTPEACRRVPDEGQTYLEDVLIACGVTAFVLFLLLILGVI